MNEWSLSQIVQLRSSQSQNRVAECFWVNLREDKQGVWIQDGMSESKMAEFKMVEFKMAAIIKLNENEWVWVRLN